MLVALPVRLHNAASFKFEHTGNSLDAAERQGPLAAVRSKSYDASLHVLVNEDVCQKKSTATRPCSLSLETVTWRETNAYHDRLDDRDPFILYIMMTRK